MNYFSYCAKEICKFSSVFMSVINVICLAGQRSFHQSEKRQKRAQRGIIAMHAGEKEKEKDTTQPGYRIIIHPPHGNVSSCKLWYIWSTCTCARCTYVKVCVGDCMAR